jgi:hypothetical protein
MATATVMNFCRDSTYASCDEHLPLYKRTVGLGERYEAILFPKVDAERDVAIECALLTLASLSAGGAS